MLPSCHSGQAETLCFLSYFHLLLYAPKAREKSRTSFHIQNFNKVELHEEQHYGKQTQEKISSSFFLRQRIFVFKRKYFTRTMHTIQLRFIHRRRLYWLHIWRTCKRFFFQICLFLGCKWAFFSLCLVPKFPQATKMAKHFASRNELENHVQIAIILKEHITNVQCRDRENTIQKTLQQNLCPKNIFYLNLPILLRWLNISPPGTYSIIMYKLELSCKISYITLF